VDVVINDNKKTMKYKKEMARYLRKNLTFGEKVLWELLRNKNFEGLRFRR